MQRRNFIIATGSVAAAPGLVHADTYPSKPIRWIVPFAPGGPNDAIARKLAEMVTGRMGQPIFIDNRPGASGSIGTREILAASPDGYLFGIGIPDSVIGAPFIVRSAKYDARSDFSPVIQIAEAVAALMARTDLGLSSMDELVKAARRQPQSIAYASWGPGSTPHLVMTAVEMQSHAQFTNVSYRGLLPAMTDFYGKQIQLVLAPIALAQQLVEKGVGLPIGMVGNTRASQFPNVATLKEQGFDAPMLSSNIWLGLIGPKGIPQAIVDRWVDELTRAIRSPQFGDYLNTFGFMPTAKPPKEFRAQLSTEFAATASLVRSMGLQPE